MKKVSATILLLLLIAGAQAQDKARYSSMNYAGLLEGSNGSAFQLQTVQGVKFNQWLTGIGIGLDYYYLRSIPLFLSVNRSLLDKPRTPYLTLDGGLNFAWYRRELSDWRTASNSDATPGLFWGAGLGYKVSMRNNKDALLLNVGYSFKQLKDEYEQPTYCINPPCPPSMERYNYKLNRVSVKLGWQL